MQNLIPSESLCAFSDEPRIKDLDLAERLGLTYLPEIRRLIARNIDELEAYGNLCYGDINPIPQGFADKIGAGRPSKAYWLNEGQALVLCALSRTPKAAEIRKALIEAFKAWRDKPVHVKEHRRALPKRKAGVYAFHGTDQALYEHHRAWIRAAYLNPDVMQQVIAGLLARIDTLENA